MLETITECLGEYLDFKNGRSSPDRGKALDTVPVFGANGQIGLTDSTNATAGSSVIGRVGSFCGSTKWLHSDSWVTDNAIIATPKRLGSTLESRYWFYRLSSAELERLRGGSGQPLLNQRILQDHRVQILKSTNDRATVAAILGALDDKIEANTKLATTADALASALYKESIQVDSQEIVLGDLAEILMGTSPTGDTLNEDGQGIKFFQGTRDFGFRFPADRVWTTSPSRIANPGDILLSVRAPVGRTNVAKERVAIGRGLAALQIKHGYSRIVSTALRSEVSLWDSYNAEGTVFGTINKNDLHRVALRLPRTQDCPNLESRLEVVESRIWNSLVENQKLAEMRDFLLPRLMSGKITVKDAEDKVSEVL